MPNVDGPMGLVPSRVLGGGCVQTSPYSVAGGYANAIFSGDPVMMTGVGTNIELAPAGSVNAIGVFAGVKFIDNEGRPQFKNYWPAAQAIQANSAVEALVVDDPSVIFNVQTDILVEGDVGALVDWVAGAGDPVTGNSKYLAEGSATALTGKSLRVLRLAPFVGNEYGAFAVAEVVFVEHALKGVVAGVGGD